MKTNKIVITSIASLLSVGILAGSLALYTKYDPNKDIDINMGEVVSKDANITIEANSTGEQKTITPDNLTNKFSHAITYEKAGSFSQSGSVVDMVLEVTTKDSIGNILTINPSISGYGNYWNGMANTEFSTPDTSLPTSDKTGYTTKTYKLEGFPLDGQQIFNFDVTLSDVDNYYTLGDISDAVHYKFSILPVSKSFVFPHIKGTIEGCTWTTDVPKFEMVMDTQADSMEMWVFKNITLNPGEIFKCNRGENWSYGVEGGSKNNFEILSSDNNNIKVKTGGTYDFSWSSQDSHAIYIESTK